MKEIGKPLTAFPDIASSTSPLGQTIKLSIFPMHLYRGLCTKYNWNFPEGKSRSEINSHLEYCNAVLLLTLL
jgi:hypothetical protein